MHIKYRACVSINSVEKDKSSDFRVFLQNQMKSMFATICNTYCIIQCKIRIIYLIYSKKLVIVYVLKRPHLRSDQSKETHLILLNIKKKTNKIVNISLNGQTGLPY